MPRTYKHHPEEFHYQTHGECLCPPGENSLDLGALRHSHSLSRSQTPWWQNIKRKMGGFAFAKFMGVRVEGGERMAIRSIHLRCLAILGDCLGAPAAAVTLQGWGWMRAASDFENYLHMMQGTRQVADEALAMLVQLDELGTDFTGEALATSASWRARRHVTCCSSTWWRTVASSISPRRMPRGVRKNS